MKKRKKAVEILQGCENSQPANFVSCEISQHYSLVSVVDCFLTRFLFGFVQLCP